MSTNNWSSDWKASKKPSKQRKYVHNAPLHVRNSLPTSHLSKELKLSLKRRSLRVRKGDKVKVLRGQFKGRTGSVERVNPKEMKVFITGVDLVKKEGQKALYPIHPSKLLIQTIDTSDKRRLSENRK
ncbi:MAG TPA: 50S ribosomal protein L24 [Candidatus Nanoarchaeia archaeon]|nr:50S ribosomal protein L24 [Candidatus Nanoarchaeia archaeon]